MNLYHEKKTELEEQQRHLNTGLAKLRETVDQVQELRQGLAQKSLELQAKDNEANQKLRQMVADQQKAEAKKVAAGEIQAALDRQDAYIRQRHAVVQEDLALAEPAVLEALAAVGNIKKQHLAEVRSMTNPPEAVKLAMESACSVLGHQIEGWKTVQSIIRRDDFISSIQNFETMKLPKALRDKMVRDYIANPTFNYETVNRASRACGPLVQWVIAQVRFSEILDKVAPLREEVASLVSQAEDTKIQGQVVMETIGDLESSIALYKGEYAVLIRETQAIRSEMERVQVKVERSMTLLDSLSSEQERWDTGSRRFQIEMDTILGDVMISAAFLAYGGFFDQHYRILLRQAWEQHLSDSAIRFRPKLALPAFLSSTEERINWQVNRLASDDLSIENALILKRYNRYPLIVDPSGQAITFLKNEYRERKITVTSFLDESFLKKLESALRFGNPLVIQDAENFDPILNSVLNRELRRTGGRTLIRFGNQDIDFSPSFKLFLSTRDPSVNFAPDICSRVTIVNLTLTRSGLQSRALERILTAERPDIGEKRNSLVKLQGEYQLRLHHLEKSLLSALNESTGSILDDDRVVGTLEVLKAEAAEITLKVKEADVIMKDVEAVTSQYMPLAIACSGIYFLLEQFEEIHHFYQFSLEYFMEIINYVLEQDPKMKAVTGVHERRDALIGQLFLLTYQWTSRTLLRVDRLVLAVSLAKLRLRSTETADLLGELDSLLEIPIGGGDPVLTLSEEQRNVLAINWGLDNVNTFEKDLQLSPEPWKVFVMSIVPEKNIPWPWPPADGEYKLSRYTLIL